MSEGATSMQGTALTITLPEGAIPGTLIAIPVQGEDPVQLRVPPGMGVGSELRLVRADGAEDWQVEVINFVPAVAGYDVPDQAAAAYDPPDQQDQHMPPQEDHGDMPLADEQVQQMSEEPFEEEAMGEAVAHTVRLDTTVGIIDIILRTDWAPLGARRCLELVATGELTDVAFYRAVHGCIAQFGLPSKRQWDPIPDDPPSGVPFLLGAVSFAAVGANSRKSTLLICLGDMTHCLGQNSWEVPIGAVAETSLDVLGQICTNYGDLAEFGGKGPDTTRIRHEGNLYLRSCFPQMTWVRSAWPLDWEPENPQDVNCQPPAEIPADGETQEPYKEDDCATIAAKAAQAAQDAAQKAATLAATAVTAEQAQAVTEAARFAEEAAMEAQAAAATAAAQASAESKPPAGQSAVSSASPPPAMAAQAQPAPAMAMQTAPAPATAMHAMPATVPAMAPAPMPTSMSASPMPATAMKTASDSRLAPREVPRNQIRVVNSYATAESLAPREVKPGPRTPEDPLAPRIVPIMPATTIYSSPASSAAAAVVQQPRSTSYTPPPLPASNSYIPPPPAQSVTAVSTGLGQPPVVLSYTPPVQPQRVQAPATAMLVQQRTPSYTPPPKSVGTAAAVMQQPRHPSYTPPPQSVGAVKAVMQQPRAPSYTPPPQNVYAAPVMMVQQPQAFFTSAPQQRPSYTPPPQPGHPIQVAAHQVLPAPPLQRPSYTPMPVPGHPSYTPPPAGVAPMMVPSVFGQGLQPRNPSYIPTANLSASATGAMTAVAGGLTVAPALSPGLAMPGHPSFTLPLNFNGMTAPGSMPIIVGQAPLPKTADNLMTTIHIPSGKPASNPQSVVAQASMKPPMPPPEMQQAFQPPQTMQVGLGPGPGAGYDAFQPPQTMQVGGLPPPPFHFGGAPQTFQNIPPTFDGLQGPPTMGAPPQTQQLNPDRIQKQYAPPERPQTQHFLPDRPLADTVTQIPADPMYMNNFPPYRQHEPQSDYGGYGGFPDQRPDMKLGQTLPVVSPYST